MSRRLILISVIAALLSGCSGKTVKEQNITGEPQTIISTNPEGRGAEISIELYKGKSFYYPLMAAWIEDAAGNFIQTLYVPTTIATGVFKYGKKENGKWVPAQAGQFHTCPRGVAHSSRAAEGEELWLICFFTEPLKPAGDRVMIDE